MRRLILLLLLLGAGAAAWHWRADWRDRAPAWARPWLGAVPATEAETARPPGGRRGPGFGGPVPVTVAAAERQDLPILLDAIGTVQAFNTVTIRAQVEGQLTEVAFREGQMVKRGDLLARIDPRAYQASLDQALAKKAQDEALLANARLDLQRYQTLARSDGVSKQQQDTQRAQVAQQEAQLAADQALIDAARTQLSFTTIRAPIDGRVGLRQVDQGNFVRAGDAAGIVTLSQLQPIAVVFTLPQQELARVQDAMARGPVQVQVVPGPGMPAVPSGELLTLDNAVDPQTGTLKLKASFANADLRLWPGAFVNVRIEVQRLSGVTTIPLVAVQRGPDGPYAFLLKPDRTVEQRPLQLGQLTPAVAEIRQGLAPGDRVVTSGALRLSPGQAVVVSDPAGTPAPAGPARRPREAAEARP
jgi:multidrug efflux system membrane fusion protein